MRIHFVIDILSRKSLLAYLNRARPAPPRTAYRSATVMFKNYHPPRLPLIMDEE